MRPPRSALLLVPVLLASALPARAQAPTCQAGVARVELTAGQAAPPALCIHPERFTALLFDAELAPGGVELQGREHFREVQPSSKSLLLVPSRGLPPGARLELEVRFADGQAPRSARFTLVPVATPAQSAQQVEVVRSPRAASPPVAEAGQYKERALRCEAQLSQAGTPQYFLLALATGKLNEKGLTVHPFKKGDFTQAPAESTQALHLSFYRAYALLGLQVRLKNEDPGRPWKLAGATLKGRNGEEFQASAVHPGTPLAPGASETRWVEWVMPAGKEGSSYTLQLWDTGKTRTVTVPDLKLP